MTRGIGRFACALLCAVGLSSHADDRLEVNCDAGWNPDDTEFASDFTALRKLAVQTNNRLCQSMLVVEGEPAEEVRRTLLDFTAASRKIFQESFPPEEFERIDAPFEHFESTLFELDDELVDADLDRLGVGVDDENWGAELYFSTMPSDERVSIAPELDAKCRNVTGSSATYRDCREALDDAARAFNAYRHGYDQYRFELNRRELLALRDDWKRFLEEGRSQTLVDVWFTTLMHQGYYAQDRLVAPAATQWFLLRPQVLYEYVRHAPDGQQGEIALGAEWIGVNWWDLKVPLGVSVVSTYADRSDTDSVGHGILLNVYNHWSLGWTWREDGDGFFVTLDLLKGMQSAREQLSRYKSMF